MAAVKIGLSLDDQSQDAYEAKEAQNGPVDTVGNGSEEFLWYVYVGDLSEFSIAITDTSESQAVTAKVRACNSASIDTTLGNNNAPQLGSDLAVGATKLTGTIQTYVGNYKYIIITASHAGGATADHLTCEIHGKMKGGN